MVRVRVPYISPRGESPTRKLFQALQPYFTPKRLARTPIVRHTLERPDATPYDGNWTYWATRKGQAIGTPTRIAKLLKKQKGKCKWCGQYFTPSDVIEVHHIVPRCLGGKDVYNNLQLLHHHTRDDKTALDKAKAVSITMEQSD
ncbi:HNH endonuclease [Limnospira maxima CS-328]|uniref:HNH endonuclease n=6 Tax=Limnospira TaxID=2596745 RepID=B5W311_LIMMA|nr:HNH endonuclease signature motif containing protein [Limnospira maxima]EDZ93554.1 HNH endonuclease [Limnospira maxima CS-328]EDZ94091.1 HNH endonuclease [Limnospira maxima CS-328]CDM97888.1 HNH endonuclease [Limnospira indica PCC 8005]